MSVADKKATRSNQQANNRAIRPKPKIQNGPRQAAHKKSWWGDREKQNPKKPIRKSWGQAPSRSSSRRSGPGQKSAWEKLPGREARRSIIHYKRSHATMRPGGGAEDENVLPKPRKNFPRSNRVGNLIADEASQNPNMLERARRQYGKFFDDRVWRWKCDTASTAKRDSRTW